LHCTPSRCTRRRPRFRNVKAPHLGLNSTEDVKPYTDEQVKLLKEKYTPEQLAAIEAGEAAIEPEDLVNQARIRNDPMRLNYLDDLATIRPTIDKPIRNPHTNYDPNWRYKTEDEIVEDLGRWVKEFRNIPSTEPEGTDRPSRLDWWKFYDNLRVTVGKEESELAPRSSLAPTIPKMKPQGTTPKWEQDMEKSVTEIIMTRPELKGVRTKVLVSHRVVNQTRLGKIASQYYLAIAGNGNGLLGIGEGKSAEDVDASKQAQMAAIRNMVPIPRYEGRTIFGEVKGKVGAVELKLIAKPPG
jgi:small subunit ribosomal protein S5